MQEELAESLNIDLAAIFRHLKATGMKPSKEIDALPVERKRCKMTCELPLQRHKRKKKCIVSLLVMKKSHAATI